MAYESRFRIKNKYHMQVQVTPIIHNILPATVKVCVPIWKIENKNVIREHIS